MNICIATATINVVYLIIMEVTRSFVCTNLMTRAKTSQWTFTNVPSTIQWVTTKGFFRLFAK